MLDTDYDQNEEELYLVYVNHNGVDSLGFNTYEFLFSESIDDIEGEDWGIVPACVGKVTPPKDDRILVIATLKTYYVEFLLAQQSTSFNMWDVIEGITPLAWENKSVYQSYPSHLLLFRFGETLKDINYKLVSWNAEKKDGDKDRNEQFLQLKY